MQRHAQAGISFLVLGLAGCGEGAPLPDSPGEPKEDVHQGLTLRTPQRSGSSANLVAEAQTAWQRGARADSLVLAVAALETGDRSPVLLGLAAAAAGSVRPRVNGERWLPACQTLLRTLRRTSTLCIGPDGAWIQRGTGPWNWLGAAVRDALWTSDQGVVLTASGRVETLEGTLLGEADPGGTLLATDNAVFVYEGLEVHSATTGLPVLGGVRSVARARSGAGWAARLDSEVVVHDLSGERRLETTAPGDRVILSPLGSHVACAGPQGVDVLPGSGVGASWSVPVVGPAALSERGDVAVATTNEEVAWRTPDGAVHRFSARPRSLRFDSGSLVVHTQDGRLRTWAPPHAELGAVRAEPTAVLHRVRGRMLQVLEDGQWQVVTSDRHRRVASGRGPTPPVAAALHPSWSHAALASEDVVTVVAAEGAHAPPTRHAWVSPRAVAWSRRKGHETLSVLDDRGLHWLDGEAVRTPTFQPRHALAWRGGLAWISANRHVERWPVSAGGIPQVLVRADASTAVAVPRLDAVVFSTPDGVVLQGTDGQDRWAAPLAFEDVQSASLAPTGDALALGSAAGRVAVVDASGGALLETPPLGGAGIQQVVWMADRRLLALDAAGTIHLVDVSVLDAAPDRLWGQLAWSSGLSVAADGSVEDAPWRVSPPALPGARSAPGVP